ncbi:LPS assembly lipoprotein LptE [Reichenbachiella carrageenanivorans]|uniref:LPS assembly lipoprotein LptE n=1 Tax=Reichenbachiella carrageenanivorans TaxID=2979869 RepID=A0ABY6CW54_9BACT|nr:LptE family protein [Reichenbachiella carrageenanivorans]UXX78149.1 LPS assembly lipoprotein LptE [Reichenbachiella carrageenanivorans]
MNWKTSLFILVAFAILNTSCGVYSFTGASISPNVKTISIQTFYNNSPLGPSNMSAVFTERIKDYYLKNTSLVLVNGEGDLQLEGSIDNYTLTPVAVSANEDPSKVDLTSLTRITIFVSATYANLEDDQFDFDQTFSFYKDFDQNREDLSANEEEFVNEIFDQIIFDIFNSSVANW